MTKPQPNRKQRRAKLATNLFDSLNLELRHISPKTPNQELAFEGFEQNKCMMLLGSAGSGKTMLSIYSALKDIKDGKAAKLVIVRSAVATADIGFLPGDLEAKGAAYEEPYVDIVNNLFGRGDAWGLLVKHDIITFRLTAYIRGITIDNAVVVYDEFQNGDLNQLAGIITRAGKNTKIHFCGDTAQSDIINKSKRVVGRFITILNTMPEYRSVVFTIDDVVRSGLAKSYLMAQHRLYGDEIIT
jgi:phosphate starvation-inducible protein PhoH